MPICCTRIFGRPKSRLTLIAILCGIMQAARSRADEPPKPATGEVQLPSGRRVEYTVYFDRNALRDSVRSGDGLIALTASGTLLRFELPQLRLVRERIDLDEVACLGRGQDGAVLAGLVDGRICRVDAATLDLTELAQLERAPQFVGGRAAATDGKARLVAVTTDTKPVVEDGTRRDVSYSIVHDLATGKTYPLDDDATTYLLDSAGRLWLGSNQGEFGGRVTKVDLTKGTIMPLKAWPRVADAASTRWQCVDGFIELRNGQIWAFGGDVVQDSWFIARIDGDEPASVAGAVLGFRPRDNLAVNWPTVPIYHVVEIDDHLFVFSGDDVFRVDRERKSWERVATLDIRYRMGRPDAAGGNASVIAVHPPTRKSEPWVLATDRAGYVSLAGPKAEVHALSGQLAAYDVVKIENSSEGLLLFDGAVGAPVWKLGAKGWEIISLAPPFERDPGNRFAELEKSQVDWYQTQVLVGPGGQIYTLSAAEGLQGTRTTARRVDGKSQRIGRETSSLRINSAFVTGDGTLWNTETLRLLRFANGRWQHVGETRSSSRNLSALAMNGPPWLLLDRDYGDLWKLEHAADGTDPRLTPIQIQEGETRRGVHAAIVWSVGTLLLATDAGLRLFDPSTGRVSPFELDHPLNWADFVARDGLGRLWVVGEGGLRMVEAGSKTLESFDRVPWVRASEVEALVPDPAHADGVVMALGDRGAAFVRAKQKP